MTRFIDMDIPLGGLQVPILPLSFYGSRPETIEGVGLSWMVAMLSVPPGSMIQPPCPELPSRIHLHLERQPNKYGFKLDNPGYTREQGNAYNKKPNWTQSSSEIVARRELIAKHHAMGKSVAEIAIATGASKPTVYNDLRAMGL